MSDTLKAMDVIDRLPGELAAALQSDPFFCDIPVVIYEKGNVVQEIQKAQAILSQKKGGTWGVAVIVLQCVADDPEPEIAFGELILRPAFQVIEQPTQNNSNTGTKKSARKIARKIRDVIKSLRLLGLVEAFTCDRECIRPVELESQNLIAYQVTFSAYECDTEKIGQVLMPQFASVNGQLVITCGTQGAAIFFTTDDSFPDPDTVDGTTSQVYSDPIAIPPQGQIIRAAAYVLQPGNTQTPDVTFIGSPVNRAIVTP